MKLFALNINSGRGSNCRVAGEARFVDIDCARAGIFDLFHLIGCRLAKPFVSYLIVKNNIPDAFLSSSFFLFACDGGNNYNGNGNEYSFHNG